MRHLAATLTLGVSALVALAPTAAPATGTCYRQADIEAEQAMHYQTELMVLSDTCGGEFYRDFTVRNRDQILSYQRQMLEHFRRTGARSPQASLDSFMTRVANEHALRDGARAAAVRMHPLRRLDRRSEDARPRAIPPARRPTRGGQQTAYRRCK